MPTPDLNISSILVYVFGGGGLIGGLVAFLKYRREGDSVIAITTEKTMAAADLVLDNLQKEIRRQNLLIEKLTERIENRDQTIKELSGKLESTIIKAKDEVIAAIH